MAVVKIMILNKLPPDMYHGNGINISLDGNVKISYLRPGCNASFLFDMDSKPHILEAYHCIRNEYSATFELCFDPQSTLCYDVFTNDNQHLYIKKSTATY